MPHDVLRKFGWLSFQPPDVQQKALDAGRERKFRRDAVVYSVNDPPGGVFAIVDGALAVTIAPHQTAPQVAHLASPGRWFGEGGYLTGQPRRVGLKATVGSTLFHVPLHAMEQLTSEDPEWMRRFGQMAMFNIDLALHTVDDLLIKDPVRRVAATLVRCMGDQNQGRIAISQAELGQISNASRKVVNRALGALAERGWLVRGYGEIEVVDVERLRRFATQA